VAQRFHQLGADGGDPRPDRRHRAEPGKAHVLKLSAFSSQPSAKLSALAVS
jgi:hypothetical protein